MLDTMLDLPGADAAPAVPPRELVVPEHSTLARSLRQRGWIVRAGWRSSVTQPADGRPGWMLRLAAPATLANGVVGRDA